MQMTKGWYKLLIPMLHCHCAQHVDAHERIPVLSISYVSKGHPRVAMYNLKHQLINQLTNK